MIGRLYQFLAHVARHPYALLPGAPRGIINDADAWIAMQRSTSPADLRRGDAAASYLFQPESLLCLGPARDALTGEQISVDRLMPIPAARTYFLRNARVIGNEGAVVSADNRVFAQFTYVDSPGGIDAHAIFRRRRFPKPQRLNGWYATLCYPSAAAYFHWLVECLPRFALIEEHIAGLDGVIVPANMEPSLKESLRHFGINEDRWVTQDVASHYSVEHLLVPAYCAGRNIPNWVSAFLRSRLLDTAAAASRRRIYVSRNDAGKRRVLNEAELMPILEKHKVEVIRARDLSLLEQAQAFDSAELVVGPHGAGLSNVLFCRSDASMLELLPSSRVGPGPFHSVAAAAGASYWCLHGTRQDESSTDDVHADFIVDASQLDRALTRLLAG